jgi:hypothetical protein
LIYQRIIAIRPQPSRFPDFVESEKTCCRINLPGMIE